MSKADTAYKRKRRSGKKFNRYTEAEVRKEYAKKIQAETKARAEAK